MKLIKSAFISSCLLLIPGSLLKAEEADLIGHMSAFQYFTHKIGLSIDNKNKKLASFYVHEVEHTLEEVMAIKSFDGHPVGKLATTILQPALEQLEKDLKSTSWNQASAGYDKFIAACNQCHETTDHEYIRISRNRDNPYSQSFKVK